MAGLTGVPVAAGWRQWAADPVFDSSFVAVVRNLLLLSTALITIAAPASGTSMAPLQPVQLRCEGLKNPLAIDVTSPSLGWILKTLEISRRDQRQTAWQVLVASTTATLAQDQGDLWNSGKVSSDENAHISYAGSLLSSGQDCWWKVRVWDESGKTTGWSEPAYWRMGLLHPTDWSASWIGCKDDASVSAASPAAATVLEGGKWVWAPEGDPRTRVPAGTKLFRRSLTLPDKPLQSAVAHIVADDQFALALNGEERGHGGGFHLIAQIDLTDGVRSGENLLAVKVTNGGDSPAGLAGLLQFEWNDGTSQTLPIDESWEVSDGAGEHWKRGEADGANWRPAVAFAPVGAAPWGMPAFPKEQPTLPARMLRKEFSLEKKVRRAHVAVCGLGLFELYVNGRRIGDSVMDPPLTQYDRRVMYLTFDLSEELRQGDNAFAVMLGNGRFYAPRLNVPVPTRSWGAPRLLLQTDIRFEDGSTTRIVSDTTWLSTTDGPIRSNNEYDGERYDARREFARWSEPGFESPRWRPADLMNGPPGRLLASPIEPMRITERRRPVRILEPEPGVFLADMGQAFYGTFRLQAAGAHGTEIRVRSAYSLRPDGRLRTSDNRSAKCTDIYIMKGEGREGWSPRFRGQGYRYLEIAGYPGRLTAGDVEGLVIHTDCEPAGSFECSHDLINRIYQNVRWGQRSFLRSVIMDPDRDERQGWLGDPAKGAEGMAWNFRIAPFFAKWLADIRANQRADGLIQDVVPTYWTMASGDVVWPSVATIVPEFLYDFYGDRRILETHYDSMRRWMAFQESRLLPDYTCPPSPYGDWCDASGQDTGATTSPLLTTTYFANNCRILERTARLLGKKKDAQHYAWLRKRVRDGFNSRYFDSVSATYTCRTQCAQLLPLAFNLVPPVRRSAAAQYLVDDILTTCGGHTSVGLVGMQWQMQTLADLGFPEVAWTIATQTAEPSWGYMISRGATTIWEHWDTDRHGPGMNSENLLILAGNVTGWMYRSLAGISNDPKSPGFRHVILRPRPVGELRFVRAHHDSPRGRITSYWEIENGCFRWEIQVPVNSTATVYVPAESAGDVTEGGIPAGEAEGVRILRQEPDATVFKVGSGRYFFEAATSGL